LGPDLTHWISAYGVWLIAGVIALECVCIPLPGETTLVAAAILAGSTHDLNIAAVIAAATIGAILGNVVAFAIGRSFGYRLLLRYGRYVHLDETRIKIGEYLFLRHGGKVVFFARFVPVLRSFAGILAGVNRMTWRDFMIANVTGAVAWVALDCTAAFVLGKELTKVAAPVGIAVAVAVVVALAFGARLLARHEQRLAAEAKRALPGPLQPPGRR
jgi:membrane protein DedA with SNARE-associated domain